mgnify:CR=1 FL=1
MKILAVDTSAVCASVAVTENGKILSEASIQDLPIQEHLCL